MADTILRINEGLYSDEPVERVPMHPEDFRALLRWVRAKEGWERGVKDDTQETGYCVNEKGRPCEPDDHEIVRFT